MRDVVDRVDLPSFRPREGFRNPRRGDREISRRVREGEAELRPEVDRQCGADGRDATPPAPPLEICQAGLRLPCPLAVARAK